MKKLLILILITTSLHAFAQKIQNFSLRNVLDGKDISLSNYSANSAVVVIFMVNACAFDDYYIDRIKTLSQQYQSKIPVLLVNADADGGESVDNMVKRAQQMGITTPYLADKDQVLMQSLNAHKSVEAFLLKNSGGDFSMAYRGAIDDNPQVASDVRHFYLKDAIENLLAGEPISVPEVRPVGCNIRKK